MSQQNVAIFIVILFVIYLIKKDEKVSRELPQNIEVIDITHYYYQPAELSPQLKIFCCIPYVEQVGYFKKTVLKLTISNNEDFEVYVGDSEDEVEENYKSQNLFYLRTDLEQNFFDISIKSKRGCVGIYTKRSYHIERQFIDNTILGVVSIALLLLIIYYVLMPFYHVMLAWCAQFYVAAFFICIIGSIYYKICL